MANANNSNFTGRSKFTTIKDSSFINVTMLDEIRLGIQTINDEAKQVNTCQLCQNICTQCTDKCQSCQNTCSQCSDRCQSCQNACNQCSDKCQKCQSCQRCQRQCR